MIYFNEASCVQIKGRITPSFLFICYLLLLDWLPSLQFIFLSKEACSRIEMRSMAG